MKKLGKQKLDKEKERFKKAFTKKTEELSGEAFAESTTLQQYKALAELVMEEISGNWADHKSYLDRHAGKQVYFFSIEFLIGRMLKSYLFNLGWDRFVPQALAELDLSLIHI